MDARVTAGEPGTMALDGEWDVGLADVLTRRLDEHLRQHRPLVIDLGRSTFLDSTALGVILGARARWEQRGLPMALVVNDGTSHPVRNALHLLGVDRVLPIFPSRDEAVGRLLASR
jgi:anti-anti-sigma factor